jgi:hypothetical protein
VSRRTAFPALLSAVLALGLVGVPLSSFAHDGWQERYDYQHHERWRHKDHAKWEKRYRPQVVRRYYREPACVVTESIYPAYRPRYRDSGLTIIYPDAW